MEEKREREELKENPETVIADPDPSDVEYPKPEGEAEQGTEETSSEEYHFIRETIKERPVERQRIFMKIMGILGGAVLFGVVAAFVFARFLPVIEESAQRPGQVELGNDEPEETPTAEPTPTETAATTPEPTPTPVPQVPVMTIDEYSEIYTQMAEVAQDAERALVTVTGLTSNEDWFRVDTESAKQASGLIVADNGQELMILTEYRAVDTVDRVMVTFWDGTILDGRYQKHDTNTGLTVVKVTLEDLSHETLEGLKIAELGNSYSITQGEPVIAIGSPMGYEGSIIYGQITSVEHTVNTFDVEYALLSTNILGNSEGSGALVNMKGQIVGIIAQNFSADNNTNVVTGLPISQLKSMIEALSNNENIPYLGIQGQNVTAELARQTGMPKGIYVSLVNADSPALQAGIQTADVVTEFDGEQVETMKDYHDKLEKTKSGQVVHVTVMRKGAEGYVEFDFQTAVGVQ